MGLDLGSRNLDSFDRDLLQLYLQLPTAALDLHLALRIMDEIWSEKLLVSFRVLVSHVEIDRKRHLYFVMRGFGGRWDKFRFCCQDCISYFTDFI